jgi:hypothetical protein
VCPSCPVWVATAKPKVITTTIPLWRRCPQPACMGVENCLSWEGRHYRLEDGTVCPSCPYSVAPAKPNIITTTMKMPYG